MKTHLITILFFCGLYSLNAQDVMYTHDANGNRIVRETMVFKTAPSQNGTGVNHINEEPLIETETYVLGHKITVYPNPTAGFLQVLIDGIEAEDNIAFYLSDVNGKVLLHEKSDLSGKIEMDLSLYSNGFYLLKVVLNGREKTWRIVKE